MLVQRWFGSFKTTKFLTRDKRTPFHTLNLQKLMRLAESFSCTKSMIYTERLEVSTIAIKDQKIYCMIFNILREIC